MAASPVEAARRAAATPAPPRAAHEIRITNARSHNLRDVCCRIPLRRLTVVSGPSGSGKSSLAFDTLFAEGQRRYVASLSTYARQFLERLPRPDVDEVTNLPPAIAIEQRNGVTGARSTVGTATEILDHLRLLFATLGRTLCCGAPVEPGSVESVCDAILSRFAGRRGTLAAPQPAGSAAERKASLERLRRAGWRRWLLADGTLVTLEDDQRVPAALRRDPLLRVVDRLRVDPAERSRLAEAVASAFQTSGELVFQDEEGARASFYEGLRCQRCGRRHPRPEPALFSFNSALGACEACQGFGRVPALDLERVVPDPGRTLAGGAIAPFQAPSARGCQRDLLRACRAQGVPTDQPFSALDEAARRFVVEGDGADWYGVRGFFEWLEGRRYKVQARVTIARYRRFDPCQRCQGMRLRDEALAVEVAGRHIGALSRETIGDLAEWAEDLQLEGDSAARGARLLATLQQRLRTARQVGIGYLSLERQVRTLSRGEAQRLQLATALGGALTASLYVLDEPSIGLHARDVGRLLGVLRAIRDQGNTVVVVEHAPEIVGAADHVIDLGPGSGRAGGSLVVEGSVAEVRAHPGSATGAVLRGSFSLRRERRGRAREVLRIRGANAQNLKDLDVEVPLGRLVAVTGVSGAGKSTLVRSVLVESLAAGGAGRGCRAVEGAARVQRVVVVEPTPPGRSQRSNPATVSKAFELLRRRFAATREARRLGLTPGWFSFNVPGGRCEACEGSGEMVVDMQFLEDLRIPCEVCEGRRYKREALEIRVGGLDIVQTLALTIDEALERFADDRVLVERLTYFARVGLGHLSLGQPIATLSGGELQRVRIALALGEGAKGVLYVLDEPTTGLHPTEVQRLLDCLDALLAQGASVIVIEHNLDVVRVADHVIDLGPEGGPAGGALVAAGPPEEIAACTASHTGAALRAAAAPAGAR